MLFNNLLTKLQYTHPESVHQSTILDRMLSNLKQACCCVIIFSKEDIRMKKQPQITKQTKANLREAFWILYTEKPVEKISIKEITELAGYNRGTFYLYYKDVYDILTQIENYILDKIQEAVMEYLCVNDTFEISKNMGTFVELMQTYSKYSAVLLSDHGDPQFTTRLKEILWPLLNRLFVQTEGYSDYQIELLAEFYLSGILATVTKWNFNSQMTIDQFITFMVPTIFPKR